MPELVIEDEKGDLGVNYIEIIPLLVEAIKEQQNQIDALQAAAQQKGAKAATATTGTAPAHGNYLLQNTPNPFGRETTIEYRIGKMEHTACIMIYDLNGRQLMKYPVGGNGKITVSSEQLQPGMYLYSLIVDGQEADTKKMIVSK